VPDIEALQIFKSKFRSYHDASSKSITIGFIPLDLPLDFFLKVLFADYEFEPAVFKVHLAPDLQGMF